MKQMVLLLPVAAGIMFGSVGVFVRILTTHGMDNATIVFLRAVFAALAMCCVVLVCDASLLKIRIKDVVQFLGTGILGMMGLNLCYNVAINELTLSLAAVLLSTAPFFVIFLAALLFHEKITPKKIFCLCLAVAGCVLTSGLLERRTGLRISSSGVFFGLLCAWFYALYGICSRMATDRHYHTYTIIFYSVAFTALVLLPWADTAKIGEFVSGNAVPHLFFLLLHALVTSVLPYMFITWALLYAEAGQVSILASGGEPTGALCFGVMLFSEIPTASMLLGLVITIGALTFVCWNTQKN